MTTSVPDGTETISPPMTWQILTPGTPRSPEWSHSGIAVDPAGTVYWADPAGGAILTRHPAGRPGRIEVPLLEIHGITHEHRAGREALWLADPGFKMRPPRYEPEVRDGTAGRFDLATREFRPLPQPGLPAYAGQPWRPTAVAIAGELVVVADGYGAGLVHFFDRSGHLLTLDGSETGTGFRCPHDLTVLGHGGREHLVVADRGNRRLVSYGLDGAYRHSLTHPSLRSPTGLAVLGETLVVTDLDGALLAVDLDGGRVEEIVAFPAGAKQPGWPNLERPGATVRPELTVGTLNSPHGVAAGPDGSLYLTEWVIGGREIRLTPAHDRHPTPDRRFP
ncbi:hypothetical protein [Amycolatopsis suaedae]|uniref:SMP-30/Gluconolactonase/LRE-like region domain-containing protein n=1 Tax=Amycolatopsis suaedae TaxID=2510978 RepID=A0A4Q7J204_9PSEU|nr:hypothetical protein [Amycolatopsis suaedae]RZQ61451.1 hypothetical protein EWH70_24040 [Amycolatopsis suaedae]